MRKQPRKSDAWRFARIGWALHLQHAYCEFKLCFTKQVKHNEMLSAWSYTMLYIVIPCLCACNIPKALKSPSTNACFRFDLQKHGHRTDFTAWSHRWQLVSCQAEANVRIQNASTNGAGTSSFSLFWAEYLVFLVRASQNLTCTLCINFRGVF